MSAFDEWAAGEGRSVVDLLTVPGLEFDGDGQVADTLRSRLWQTFEAGRRSDPYAAAVSDALSRTQSQIDALRARVDLIQAPQSVAAGPWVPGEPPEKRDPEMMLWLDRGPAIGWWSRHKQSWEWTGGLLRPEEIYFYARINPPKQEGRRQTPAISRPNKHTVAVDFDGVLHSYVTAWEAPEIIPDPPVPGAIAWLKEVSQRLAIVIHTTRGRTPDGQEAVRAWLVQNGWPDGNNVTVTAEKLPALVYLDDRALRFTGDNWPSADDIYAARPWNRPKKDGGDL